jgi:methyl-accepting chemotaxis protein
VATSASKVGELVGEIAAASQEQASGIEQVNKAVAEMDKVIQQTAANGEESASASEEMNAQAEQIKRIVGDLMVIVTGGISRSEGLEQEITNRGTTAKKKEYSENDQMSAASKSKPAKNEHTPEEVIPMGSYQAGGQSEPEANTDWTQSQGDEGEFKDF